MTVHKNDFLLIVDDDKSQIKTLTDIFEEENFRVISAETGTDALKQCQNRNVPVAIVDLRLPDMTGVELLATLKSKNPRMLIIIHTAYASIEAAIGAVNLDAFAFVPKMNEVSELIEHVHRAYHHYYAGYSNELQKAMDERTRDLETAKHLYQNLYENTPSMYLTTSYNGIILQINSFGAEQLGYSKDELVNTAITDLIQESDRSEFINKTKAFLDSDNELGCGEIKLVCKDHFTRWVNMTVRKSVDMANQPVLLFVCEDISAKKKIELENQHNMVLHEILNKILTSGISGGTLEAHLSASLDILLETPNLNIKKKGGIFLADPDAKRLKMAVQKGLPSELLLSCGDVAFGQCLCGRAALTKKIQFADCLDHRHEITYQSIEEHGHYNVPILANEKVLGVIVLYLETGHQKDEKEMAFLQSIANTLALVIERSHYEQELKLISQAIEQSPSLIFITDIQGNIEYANPCFLTTTGYSLNEIIGKKPSFLKSGQQSRELYKDLWDTILKGKTWHGEVRNTRKDGSSFWEEKQVSPMFDENGQIIRFLSLGKDVTARKALEQQLRQAQKMETIGTLAGGIAHDFNNILTPIFGYLDLAGMDALPGSKTEMCIKQIRTGAERARDLVKQILNFSRRTESEKRPLQLSSLVKEVARLLSSTLPSNIEIRLDIQSDKNIILADATQMHQLLMNLATNAAHAMRPKGGKLDIQLEPVIISNTDSRFPNLAPGTYIHLAVKDSGIGMNKDVCERIFEPFYTTKNVNEGTGLGLSVVHGIVKDQNGEIFVNSEPGTGTIFDIFFPALNNVNADKIRTEEEKPQSGKGHILFVDDEKTIVELAEQVLKKLSYQVTIATNSSKALQLFKNTPDNFDLLITDQTMPGMTGLELAEKILNIRPGFPIILTTGFSKSITNKIAADKGIKSLLPKPFSISQLANTIFKVLENISSQK